MHRRRIKTEEKAKIVTSPQTEAKSFAFSSVFILCLCLHVTYFRNWEGRTQADKISKSEEDPKIAQLRKPQRSCQTVRIVIARQEKKKRMPTNANYYKKQQNKTCSSVCEYFHSSMCAELQGLTGPVTLQGHRLTDSNTFL